MKKKENDMQKKYPFFKISDLLNGEYQILIGGRETGKSTSSAIIMLKWLKSVLMVYEDKGKLVLGIKPQYNEEECIDVIRGWLYDED